MTNDSKDSSKNAPGSRRRKRRADAAEGSGIGWGLSIEDQDERFFMRVLAFCVAVGVVAFMGVWLMVTTLSGRQDSDLALSATGRAPGEGTPAYTVVLRTVAPGQLAGLKQLIATDAIQALAGESGFYYMELEDGSTAVCVGRSPDEDSPQLEELLSKFRQIGTSSGARPFEGAQIRFYRQ